MTPRDGEAVAVAEIVGVAAPETMIDWVPAVLLLKAHLTMTVYVPGLTFDQAADCSEVVPDRAAWRPWLKFAWLLVSSEAVPQPPVGAVREHAVVVTETVDPEVLTEMPGAAAAGPAVRASGSAATAATVRPERRSG
jgi:hypothetical protein